MLVRASKQAPLEQAPAGFMKFLPAQSLSSRRDSLENPSSKACGNNYTKGVENQYLASLGVKRMSERHLGGESLARGSPGMLWPESVQNSL